MNNRIAFVLTFPTLEKQKRGNPTSSPKQKLTTGKERKAFWERLCGNRGGVVPLGGEVGSYRLKMRKRKRTPCSRQGRQGPGDLLRS